MYPLARPDGNVPFGRRPTTGLLVSAASKSSGNKFQLHLPTPLPKKQMQIIWAISHLKTYHVFAVSNSLRSGPISYSPLWSSKLKAQCLSHSKGSVSAVLNWISVGKYSLRICIYTTYTGCHKCNEKWQTKFLPMKTLWWCWRERIYVYEIIREQV